MLQRGDKNLNKMCLKVKSKLKIAQQDLYCLKIAEHVTETDCISFFQYKLQPFGKLFKTNLGKRQERVHEGYHTYQFKPTTFRWSFDDCQTSYGIILCCIPKGSEYYLGSKTDIVSNQLILIEPLVLNAVSRIKLEEKFELETIQSAFNLASKIAISYHGEQNY